MKRLILAILTGLFCLGVLVSGTMILNQHKSKAQAVAAFTELRETLPPAASAGEQQAAQPGPGEVYGQLAAANNHMAGWVRISGTSLDYPVMHTPADPEFYLDRGFDQAKSIYGVPFADAACDFVGNGPIIVYGHNMADGQMFATLLDYRLPAFYQEHQLINFDTLAEFGVYQIVAVLQINVSVSNPKAVDLAQYASFPDEAAFAAFQAMCWRESLYDTGQTMTSADQLLILATCEYSEPNGRMVLVAKRLAE